MDLVPRAHCEHSGGSRSFIPVNLLAGEHKHPDFLRLNPAGKFPVLVDGDIVIPESAAIVLYLADKYREKKLLPASVGERARSIAGSCSPTLENQQAHGALSTPTLTRDGALGPTLDDL